MFDYPQKVLFKHCDPAGIVFYPRYFEMINDCVEAFFADALDWPFEELLKEAGVPTAEITTKFSAPSRHGDRLVLTLNITRLGRTSLGYSITASCQNEQRFTTQATLVYVSLKGRATPWPSEITYKINHLLGEQI